MIKMMSYSGNHATWLWERTKEVRDEMERISRGNSTNWLLVRINSFKDVCLSNVYGSFESYTHED